MITELRDRLRDSADALGVARASIVCDGDAPGALPRLLLSTVADPRATDLDGASDVRRTRVQLDAYAEKQNGAAAIADAVEALLEVWDSGAGVALGVWSVLGAEVVDRRDGAPVPPASGQGEAVNRTIVDAVFALAR